MWHTLPLEKILSESKTDLVRGLTEDDAKMRLFEVGANVLPSGKETSWVGFLLRQLKSPLVYILLIGALLTIVLKEWVDMSVILLAVFVNVSVGFWQEFRSSHILEKLRALVEIKALVVRDGSVHEIDAARVVPGDIFLLRSGSKVPADARIVSGKHLEANEALLTGESTPVKKGESIVERMDASVGDRTNMVHMGTVISGGDGRALVVATGAKTEIGKITLLTQKAQDDPTPLQVRIGKLGKVLAIVIGFASVFIFFIGLAEGHSFKEMFTTAIAVAVAAIPEGLPAAISIVLAVSAQRILKRKGVVKRLVAAETLGGATVICADKTGTLTEGKMKVEKLLVYGNEKEARQILALANEALIEKTKEGAIVRGETTDRAKMEAFLQNGGDLERLLERYPRIDLLQFDSSWNYIASFHKDNNSSILFLTGSSEALIALSDFVQTSEGPKPLLPDRKKEIENEYLGLAGLGYRVIAIAERRFNSEDTLRLGGSVDLRSETAKREIMRELTFVGFVAIRDPIRADVRESIQIAREAGIRSIMLTGDHVLTAQAIGRELGFTIADDMVMDGRDVERMPDDLLGEKLKKVQIFARVNPSHKMRIVDILQRQGEVVAMTGDGVNDAPALKSADIGVALDSGTDVSKEASDLILLNDSFSIIVSAIKQGRIAFDNIRKVTVFLLVQSFTELILILAALVFRIPLPMTAVQILWTNLIEDSLPNIALSFEPGEKDVMKRKPIKKNEPILDKESRVIVFVIGILTDIFLLGLFLFLYYFSNLSLEHIQTFIFVSVGLDSFFYIYAIKSLRRPIFSYNLLNNSYLIGATILGVGGMLGAIYVPFLNSILDTIPLDSLDWSVILGLGILKIIGVEVVKWWFFWRKDEVQEARLASQ